MTANADLVWSSALDHLRAMLTPEIFTMWFAPLKARAMIEGLLQVEAHDDFSASWMRDHYRDLVRAAVCKAAGQAIDVDFVPGPGGPASGAAAKGNGKPATAMFESRHDNLRSAGSAAQSEADDSDETPARRSRVSAEPSNRPGELIFNPNNTFETFVVGGNNNLAHGAAMAVAQSPGRAYNPLFLFGGVGLGKTHLLHAIGHHVLRHRKNPKVAYLSCEKFTNEFIESLKNGQLPRFRKKYRQVDLLLIDDVQFLTGKEQTQEEFFHTFNSLHDHRKQIVLTCDRPANEIQGLEQRLTSRFEWGLSADLQPPDVETRLAILQKKESLFGVQLIDEVRNFIAQRIRTNIRRLEGAFYRVASYSTLTGKPVNLEAVESLLREILQQEGRHNITIEIIQKRVAEHYDIRLADMTSKRRPENIAFPRQVAMYLARNLTDSSLSLIGEAFGGRDHGTVLHACRAVKDRMETDNNVRHTVGYLEKQLVR